MATTANMQGQILADADSVQGQLGSMLNSNSPLMKRAETYGKQQANRRGLLNSSMAAGASQGAMIDAAMPAAQQDAGYQQQLGQMAKSNEYNLNELQASSTANAWGVMANNVTDIVAQGMEGIANINANPDITAADKTKMISQIKSMRDSDISFQQNLYKSLSGYLRNTGLFPSL